MIVFNLSPRAQISRFAGWIENSREGHTLPSRTHPMQTWEGVRKRGGKV